MKGVYNCELVERKQMGPGALKFVLRSPEISKSVSPGQFVNVKVSKGSDPLLRRPFSIHWVDRQNGLFGILFVLVGRGTSILSDYKVGDSVDLIGPLGKGFDIGDDPDTRHLLVAGGCGAAPIHFLCQSICDKFGCGTANVLLGARNSDAVLCETEFGGYGVNVDIATDDGSYGFHGTVVDLLSNKLAEGGKVRVYSCGPNAMLRAVSNACETADVESCQISLENNMSCGFGVCLGCVQKIKVGDGWEHRCVCKDGPVFEANEVIW